MSSENPVNKLPFVVVGLTVLIVGLEILFQLGDRGLAGGAQSAGWRLAAVQDYGFSAGVLDQIIMRGDYSAGLLKRFVTYPFVNQDLLQVAFCAGLTLALGKFTGEYYGEVRVLVIYFAAAIVGALVYGALVRSNYPLFGGYTPVYGLIGAYTYALWLRLSQAGENQIMAFRLIGVLLAVQLLFGLFFGAAPTWIAELAGFATGFALSLLLAPGGWAAFVARMRQRD